MKMKTLDSSKFEQFQILRSAARKSMKTNACYMSQVALFSNLYILLTEEIAMFEYHLKATEYGAL